MDVDSPSNLKRSSSAPMINDLNNTSQTPATSRTINLREESAVFNEFASNSLSRPRRFSASCSSAPVPELSPRLSSSRVNQLRREERPDSLNCREWEHEREVHSQMQMSQSCEDLALLPSFSNNNGSKDVVMTRCGSPLSPGSLFSGSYSPTRDKPTPTKPFQLLLKRPLSPSPTRKTFMSRRSLSPIAMRPSALTPVKRKFELDSDTDQMGSPGSSSSSSYLSPPAKRLSIGTTSLAFGPDGMRNAPLSPGGGRFLFKPLTSTSSSTNNSSSSTPASPLLIQNNLSRDVPMLDEEEEAMLLAARNKESNNECETTQNKDTVMTSLEST